MYGKVESLFAFKIQIYLVHYKMGGPGSSVGIVTDYGLDGPGSNPGGGRDVPPVQTGPGAHPASCTLGTGSFPEVKGDRGVMLTAHPFLVPRSWKNRAIPLPTLWAKPGLCKGITLPFILQNEAHTVQTNIYPKLPFLLTAGIFEILI